MQRLFMNSISKKLRIDLDGNYIFYNKLLSCDGSSQRNYHVTEVRRLITLLGKGGDISFGDNRGSLRGLGRGYSIEGPRKLLWPMLCRYNLA